MFLLPLFACAPVQITLDKPVGDSGSVDSGMDSGPDSGADSDSGVDSGEDSGADSDTDTAIQDSYAAVSNVTATVDPDVHTLIHVTWTQDEAADGAWLEFGLDGEDTMTSPVRAGGAGLHEEVILGVPAESDVHWRIVNQAGAEVLYSEETWTTTTGVLPNDLPDATVVRYDPTLASPERWVLGSIDVGDYWYYGPFWAFIVDRYGRYVWYHEIPDSKLALYVQPAESGDHVFLDGSTQYVFHGSVDPTVTRMTLDGRYFNETVIPDYGFAIEEKGDGSILYEWRGTGDYELHSVDASGHDSALWSCNDYMRSIGAASGTRCNPNTIVWDAKRNTVFWSMYYIDTVLEVDLDDGTTLRQFGQLAGGWTFDPADSVVDYQHYVNWSPTGTIMASTHVTTERDVQVCNEYAVDDRTQTLTRVWQYESPDYYAEYAGECVRLANQNTLVGYGVDGALVEITHDQQVAWEITWDRVPNTHLIGHMTLTDDLYPWNEGP